MAFWIGAREQPVKAAPAKANPVAFRNPRRSHGAPRAGSICRNGLSGNSTPPSAGCCRSSSERQYCFSIVPLVVAGRAVDGRVDVLAQDTGAIGVAVAVHAPTHA